MEVREMILQTMRAAGQPLNAGRIAELTGLDRKVVERALALLKKDGDIVSPVRCRW
ncbi:MAG: HTH domain-containing protein, partial [Clostridia bacterium]|nr:HTH domain-containing protein [Clostridia bacterium]